MIDDSNDETNFPQKLLLTDRQVLRLRKACTNNSPANIKLPKTQLFIIVQLGGVLGPLSGLSLLLNPEESAKKLMQKWSKIKTL